MYKRQTEYEAEMLSWMRAEHADVLTAIRDSKALGDEPKGCLLYTSDAADERSSVDLGGRRIIKKKNI